MTDDGSGDGGLRIADVPWLLVEPGRAQDFQVPEVILVPPAGAAPGWLLPLFTDEDLARHYAAIRDQKGVAYEPVRVANLAALRDLLVQLRDAGISHVIFNTGPESAQNRPIQSVIDTVAAG